MTTNNGNLLFSDLLGGIPAVPPRQVSLLPGLSKKNAVPRSTIAFVLLFCLIPVLFILMMFLDPSGPMSEFKRSQGVEAKVLDVVSNSDGECEYKTIHYSFETKDRKTFYGQASAKKGSTYYPVEKGGVIPVKYDPSVPSESDIDRGSNNSAFLFIPMCFFLLILPAFFIGAILPGVKSHLLARRIFSKGHLTQGEVVFVKSGQTNPLMNNMLKSQTFQVFFKYRNKTGETLESSVKTDNGWLINQLKAGDLVHVVYMENKPSNAILLECYIR